MIRLIGGLAVGLIILAQVCLADGPYTYSFPKPPAEWGSAVAFGNLSPGFFQVMFQSKAGIMRIATYGIVGASMDNLKDPQLMMVFAFDQKETTGKKIKKEKWLGSVN